MLSLFLNPLFCCAVSNVWAWRCETLTRWCHILRTAHQMQTLPVFMEASFHSGSGLTPPYSRLLLWNITEVRAQNMAVMWPCSDSDVTMWSSVQKLWCHCSLIASWRFCLNKVLIWSWDFYFEYQRCWMGRCLTRSVFGGRRGTDGGQVGHTDCTAPWRCGGWRWIFPLCCLIFQTLFTVCLQIRDSELKPVWTKQSTCVHVFLLF